jgi:hypothetical protein
VDLSQEVERKPTEGDSVDHQSDGSAVSDAFEHDSDLLDGLGGLDEAVCRALAQDGSHGERADPATVQDVNSPDLSRLMSLFD